MNDIDMEKWECTKEVEWFKAANTSGQTAIKSAILINGGAAVAMLAFAGKIYTTSPPKDIPENLVYAMACFGAGVLFGAFAAGTVFASQFLYGRGKDMLGHILNGLSCVLIIFCYISFFVGSWVAFKVFLNNGAVSTFLRVGDIDSNSVKVLAENSNSINSFINIIPAVISAAATCLVAGVAVWGIRFWREEFIGKRRIELAEDALALFYEAKNALIAIRSSFGYGGEGATRKQKESETQEQKAARDSAFVVFERYKEREQVFNKMLSMRYRFMAQIGKTEAEPFEEMRSIVNKVFQAARWLADLWSKDTSHYKPDELEKHFETVRKYEAIFWEDAPDDEISNRIEKAVADMEQTCNNIIVKGRPE